MTSQHYLNQPGDLMKLPPETLRAERVWIDFADLNRLAERGAAHEAFITSYGVDKAAEFVSADEMTRLIAQAVAAEREACLKACKELLAVSERSAKDGDHFEIGRENAHTECIEAISARSQP